MRKNTQSLNRATWKRKRSIRNQPYFGIWRNILDFLHRWNRLLQVAVPAFFSFLLLLVVIFQAKISERQWREMQVTRELENRAWLMTKGASMSTLTIGQPMSFAITFRNSGRSPAIDARVNLVVEVRDSDTGTSERYQHKALAGAVIGPREEGNTFKHSDFALDQKTYDLLSSRKKILYIEGTIEYKDIFEVQHQTTFCLKYLHPIANLEDCGGNAT